MGTSPDTDRKPDDWHFSSEVHRTENPNNTLLEIVEVQSGICLSEVDIVRFENA